MAIRKDLDDMLNSLMDGGSGGGSSSPARSHNTPRAARKSKFDDMSVDDLLHALEEEKHGDEELPVSDDTPPAVWEFAPPSEDIPVPDPVSPDDGEEDVPSIISEVMHTEASAETTRVFDTIPMTEEIPKPVKKKKIVITGELPDYEALRREEMEREKQAQRAAEAAAEEAHAAERARRAAEAAAERARLKEEARLRRQAQEEAERLQQEQEAAERQRRIEEARLAEEAERQRRIAQIEAEKQRRAAEAAEQARLAEEAERARLAEEAENARIAAEAEQARLAMEAEQQRRIEEMKRLAEEAVRDSAEINDNGIADEVDNAIEALGDAAAEAAPAVEAAPEEAEKPKKMGFFKKLISKAKEETETAEEKAPEDGLFENSSDQVSATDLIDAAIAAINHPEEEAPVPESDPVGDILDNIREDAAEAIDDISSHREPSAPKQLILSDEDIIAGLTPELKERFDELTPDKQRQVIDMRRSQLGGIAPPAEEDTADAEEFIPEEEFTPEPEIESISEALNESEVFEDTTEEAPAPAVPEQPEKAPEKPASALKSILNEDPDKLVAQRREHTEFSPAGTSAVPNRKKPVYTILGVVLSVFAVIGIIATALKVAGSFHSFTSGEVKKDSFTQMIYPAAIMDIEPFSDPSQLTSEQIITATIWSIIMDEKKVSNYELTLDTVSIPDVDVEKYAVELFGENLPPFSHSTVGPVESRFYYADGVYNVKAKTITHTYAPEIKTIVKNGKEYTLTVDYIAELPQWMENTVAKQAEYKLTEKEDGTFRFNSMKILNVNNGNL
ncbi:hypothetical protein [Ruminococcus sp.]|uniref:hypothetical protein n=1 Tax=Ruminococcus sp. TaxID=41978 RepID=UPI0025E06AF5|nr:hypothetical protein [Ruminococcus sp.]